MREPEHIRRLRALHTEHIEARDRAMKSARKWRQWALDEDNIAALFQAEDWVKSARRSNHHALACKPSRYGVTP